MINPKTQAGRGGAITAANYIVAFEAKLSSDDTGYSEASEYLNEKVKELPGYLGEKTYYDGDSIVSITYWQDLGSIRQWRLQPDHRRIQHEARQRWYSAYAVTVCKIERAYHYPD